MAGLNGCGCRHCSPHPSPPHSRLTQKGGIVGDPTSKFLRGKTFRFNGSGFESIRRLKLNFYLPRRDIRPICKSLSEARSQRNSAEKLQSIAGNFHHFWIQTRANRRREGGPYFSNPKQGDPSLRSPLAMYAPAWYFLVSFEICTFSH